MTMAPPPAACGGLDAKHYTLAALAATLVAAAVVIVVSVVLSPAHISFSITDARSDFTSYPAQLLLTLAADNPSRRAAVRYLSIFVDVGNSSGIPMRDDLISAEISTRLPLEQPRRSEIKVNATVGLVEADDFTSHKVNRHLSVMVTTVARFKVGVMWTRLYEINFCCCGNVDFFSQRNESRRTDCQPVAPY